MVDPIQNIEEINWYDGLVFEVEKDLFEFFASTNPRFFKEIMKTSRLIEAGWMMKIKNWSSIKQPVSTINQPDVSIPPLQENMIIKQQNNWIFWSENTWLNYNSM